MKKNGKSNFLKVTTLILVITCSLLFTKNSNSQSSTQDLENTANTINTVVYVLIGATVIATVAYLIISNNAKNERREKRKAIDEKNSKQADSTAVKTDTTSVTKPDSTKNVKQKDSGK